jgi:hypothetical protein
MSFAGILNTHIYKGPKNLHIDPFRTDVFADSPCLMQLAIQLNNQAAIKPLIERTIIKG